MMMSDHCIKCFKYASDKVTVTRCRACDKPVCFTCGTDSPEGFQCKSHIGAEPLKFGVYDTPFPERTPVHNGYVYVERDGTAWHIPAQYNGWFDMALKTAYTGPTDLTPLRVSAQTTLINAILPPGKHVCECEVVNGTHGGCRIVPCDKDVREGKAYPSLAGQWAIREAHFGL